MVGALVYGDQLENTRQRRIAAIVNEEAEVSIVDEGSQFLNHRVDDHAQGTVVR